MGNLSHKGTAGSSRTSHVPLFGRKSLLLHGVLLLLWLVCCYYLVGTFVNKRLDAALQSHAKELEEATAAVTYHFDHTIAFLHIMPTTVAADKIGRASCRERVCLYV